MPKVTSKLQLTVPKKIADQYGIRPGDRLEWIPAGESIRVELARRASIADSLTTEERIALFNANMKRADQLLTGEAHKSPATKDRITRANRGWTREELYGDRGLPRRH